MLIQHNLSKYSPIVICKRLINFISSRILRRPGSSRDPEITVEFKHTDNHSENYADHTPMILSQKGSADNEKHQQIPVRDSDRQKTGTVTAKGKGLAQEADRASKRPKKTVSIKEDEKMAAKKDQANDNNNNLLADRAAKARNPPRHWGPLLSVASNINEKCEAFINSRKRAMRRNLTLDPEKS